MGLAVGPGAGGGRASSEDRVIVRLVDWLKRQNEPISEELWASIVRTSRQTQDIRAAQRAQQMLADRIDPIPKSPVLEITTGPVTIGWNPDTSSSLTPHAPSRPSFTPPSNGNGHAPRLSSATDALESL